MNPLQYEINTRCWLRDLSDRHGGPVTLATVPEGEFTSWQQLGFTHIWLMGVWATGPRARQLALDEPSLRRAYDRMIPGWNDHDVGGSPYSIADYHVPEALGGDGGLKAFREKLHERGLKLILDFVPNHLGFDHPWVAAKPELFVQSPVETPGTFEQQTADGIRWIAYAKDPFFPFWSDVAQLDYRNPETRRVMRDLLLSVAARCDGVRCDMAMLLLNDVIARTWSHLPYDGTPATGDFWADAIPAVKQADPGFIFMAEVYWGLEGHLQWLGFDYTYDKQLYDDLIWRHTWDVQQRLLASPEKYVAASVHFLENHDEPRVAASLKLPEHKAAALTILGLPGMRFLHEGQLTGARIKVPVQLSRRPVEPAQVDVQQMYESLLATLKNTAVGNGEAKVLAARAAWPANPTAQHFLLVQWQAQGKTHEFDLVVVNLAPHRSQCYAPINVVDLESHDWIARDLLGNESYERTGGELFQQGLYLDVPEQGAQLFHFTPVADRLPDWTLPAVAPTTAPDV